MKNYTVTIRTDHVVTDPNKVKEILCMIEFELSGLCFTSERKKEYYVGLRHL